MKTNLKYSESVEQYLSKEMGKEARLQFEKDAAENPDISGELSLSRTIDAALKQDDVIDLRMKLLAAYRENQRVKPEVPVVRMYVKKFWYAAASLILLAAIGSALYFNMPGSSANERLFKEYYSPENLITVTRSGDANIVEAVMKFQEGNYPVAEQLFKQILDKDQSNFAGWFYYGISCIETGHYNLADDAFNRIINDDQNLYVEHAGWYLGLNYLKSNRTDKAKEQLMKIAQNPDNIHRKDARHLLDELGK